MEYSKHYNEQYYAWQKSGGSFGGLANIVKFQEFLGEDLCIIDFGCGGAFLLQCLRCREKIGIEVNEVAWREANAAGIRTFRTTQEAPDDWADLIISNNALEHSLNPLDELRKLHKKLKRGGKIVFIIPCESIRFVYKPNDINHHLFGWSPMAAGNLFTEAGFHVLESKSYIHKWPKHYQKIRKLFGDRLFNIICRIYGRIENSWHQVRVVAEKL